MASKKRVAEDNLGAFMNPTDVGGGGFVVPMEPLKVGPGKPGPEDDWQMPDGPTEADELVDLEPVPPARVSLASPRD